MTHMRLFIAIELSPEAKQLVKDVQETFRWQHVGGNYTPEENLHITLAFIGEYGDPDSVLEALSNVSIKRFEVTLDTVGCFGDLWWIGASESKTLDALAGKVRHALADAEIPYDRKRFKTHVTILRKPVYRDRQISHMTIEPVTMKVERIRLMRSTRGKNGMIYTELGAVEAEG